MKELRERVGGRLVVSLSVSMFVGFALNSGATVSAQGNARKEKVLGQQLLDPFSLEMVLAADAAIAAREGDRQGNRGESQGPLVDVPVRRRPRSPYVPPGPPDVPPPGPPPWVL
ncbi:MAG: hypothetical protein JSW27_04460 [Phycisphaerales bacterium]|nr:MAG: hypothetical protein JSW27_04460 [Phycisphaerales bacterium]